MEIESVAVNKPVCVWIDDPNGTFPKENLGDAILSAMPGDEVHVYRVTAYLDGDKTVPFEGDVVVFSPDTLTPEEIEAAIGGNEYLKNARRKYGD